MQVGKEAFQRGLQVVAQAVPRKHLSEAVDNRFLLSSGRTVAVKATDYNTYIEWTLPKGDCTVEEGGEVLLPLDRVQSVLRECPEDRLAIETNEGARRCLFRFADGHLELQAGDSAEFPVPPRDPANGWVELEIGEFLKGVIRARIARGAEEGRYLVDHLLFESGKGTFEMVSTDGRRLARYRGKAKGSGKNAVRALFSRAVVQEAQKLCENSIGGLRVAASEGKAFLVTESGKLVANLRDEKNFPKHDEYLERKRSRRVTMSRLALVSATRRMSILTTDEERGVEFRFRNGELSLAHQSGTMGAGEIRVPCSYEGDEESLLFDPEFLSQGLQVMEGEEVELHLGEASMGALLKEGEEFQYLVMPIVLAREAREGES